LGFLANFIWLIFFFFFFPRLGFSVFGLRIAKDPSTFRGGRQKIGMAPKNQNNFNHSHNNIQFHVPSQASWQRHVMPNSAYEEHAMALK
jgi:hypothetical protein